MMPIKNWIACFILVLGAACTFGLIIVSAWFLLGVGAAVAFGFASICAMATALNRAFADDKPEEPADQWTAEEGPIHVAGNGALYVFEGDRCKTVIR